MELTIEKTQPHLQATWFQAYLVVGELVVSVGHPCAHYHDCRYNAEKFVEEMARQGVSIKHSKIYDLMDEYPTIWLKQGNL